MSYESNIKIILDTNNFTFYNNKKVSNLIFWINQKYSSEDNKIYILPIEKQKKFNLKQKQLKRLYILNRNKYYLFFIYKLLSKYIRKQLINDLISTSKSCLLIYILENIWSQNSIIKSLLS
jgi:hypothetical protein